MSARMTELMSNLNVGTDVPERFDPKTMHGESIEAEHFARYRWATQFAAGRRVLDAGCGVGYGAVILAQSGASEVIGIDIAPNVVATAAKAKLPNLVFAPGDVTRLPYEDDHFDLVVCFEVIEHLAERDLALDEFRRVLRADGLLALSSPNRDIYPPGNPHHVHEYLPEELRAALQERFSFVQLHRQYTWVSSGIVDDEHFAAGNDVELKSTQVRKLAGNRLGQELYTVALAGPATLPESNAVLELAAPVELRRWDRLWHEQDDVLRQQMHLLQERDDSIRAYAADQERRSHELWLLREQLVSAEQALARMPALEAKAQELTRLNDELIAFSTELTELRDAYMIVIHSSSWRLTSPLRRVAAILRKFR
jgi:2-polyprenyl-3-methyl-5-hydroxy-6-metoxy-1,4-benzoquinol methylase